MIKQVDIFGSYLWKIVRLAKLKRLGLNPLSVFKIASACRNFPNVDLRIEISCKWVSVITRIGIDYIYRVDFIKMML